MVQCGVRKVVGKPYNRRQKQLEIYFSKRKITFEYRVIYIYMCMVFFFTDKLHKEKKFTYKAKTSILPC